jgi:hypothetical protein
MKTKKTTYYVYAKGILNLYALVFQTTDRSEAENVAEQYQRSVIRKKLMN